ncbi:putative proline-rich receptor-like protein kinase PERK3 [Iris pallida]|uniref:Proline-rich receptor-like protein kinase PERK3 n=1 Tax=Iris pallida TaxID=29817 RepID=A0AAX6DQE5_IRIPA|nr:putative proline-rich receptor-like protein kinase PERK3 [Iris pallida]
MRRTPELRDLDRGEGRLSRATRGCARPIAAVACPGAGRGGVSGRYVVVAMMSWAIGVAWL